MDVLKRNKVSHRSSFTKSYNCLDELIKNEDVDPLELEIALELFKKRDDSLELIHQNFLDGIEKDTEFNTEFESVETYREKALRIKIKAKKALEDLNQKRNKNKNSNVDSSHLLKSDEDSYKITRLPKIELFKFSGELREWLQFWNQFQKIHESKELNASEKFHYLIQSTVANSTPREIVSSYPVTDENYELAIQSLKERYNRNDILIEIYVRDLLGLVLNNANKKKTTLSLSCLYNKLSTQLRALSSLGVTNDNCAIILFPLVESCLPLETLRVWERYRMNLTENVQEKKTDLDNILSFLRKEVESEERIKLARSDFLVNQEADQKKLAQCQNTKEKSLPSATELITQNYNVCCFCHNNHESKFCRKAYFIPMSEKRDILRKNGLCFICLVKGHTTKACKNVNIKCNNCSRQHLKILCPLLDTQKSTTVRNQTENTSTNSTDTLHSHTNTEVFLQTLAVKIIGRKTEREVRVIIDTGSQKSYILKSTAVELGYKPIYEESFSHSLFGGTKTEQCNHECYNIKLSNLSGNYTCTLDAFEQKVICNDIPSICHGPWMNELKGLKIKLTDFQRGAGPIEVLLGADVAGKLFTGKQEMLKSGLVAMGTKLGWTLIGKVPKTHLQENVNMNVISMFTNSMSISHLWDLELVGIRDPIDQKNKEDQLHAVLEQFRESVSINEENRYEIKLPWKTERTLLPDNFDLSLKRLNSTCKKLDKDGLLKEYGLIFKEWLEDGIIEECPKSELNLPGHFLPHRPVVKESSTTRIRPVFDASARVPNLPSLNDFLETGINLIEKIPAILSRFRKEKIGVISDIKKAFLQISVHKNDRDFLRFLWYDDDGNLKVLRHSRVVFGVTSSPFLLGAVIDYHLNNELRSEHNICKSTIEKLSESFYVDNCVTSLDNEQNLEIFIKEATQVMQKGKFELRGWESNESCIERDSKSNVLGLVWDRNADTLQISTEKLQFDKNEKVTKRSILSFISKIYDPLGIVSPVLLFPKILLQSTWKAKEHWDSELRDDVKKKFLKWVNELSHLNYIRVPRWIGITNSIDISFHTFCDASQKAYAAAVFIRCESEHGVTVRLLQTKARISPLKPVTIPRLELLAATIGARLYESTRRSLKIDNVKSFLWTDSSTVLTWLTKHENWSIFVYNRVSEIRKLTDDSKWLHLPGKQNPADLLSRGCGAKKLSESLWWEGPTWLRESEDRWPKSVIDINEEEVNKERKRTTVTANNLVNESVGIGLAKKFSKYTKIVRIMAWILRFRPKAKTFRSHSEITEEELLIAEKVLLRNVQLDSFSSDSDLKSLKHLEVFGDEDGILHMKSRLTEDDEKEFTIPIILPSKHPIVERLIEHQHFLHKHVGTLGLLTILRERFWIIKGRKTVKSVIQRCVTCKRYQEKPLAVPIPPLPKDRTELSNTFQVVGVDLAGPIYTKTNEKLWVVIFTCAVYRAVHLELISSLSTSAFIQSLRRFISRRGRMSTVYSDNGTNFVGLNKELKNLDWKKIQKEFELSHIKWKFNPPTAPWWGGFWERLIRILKDLLRKNLGRASLTYDELLTLICECESILNNRPLTYVSDEPELKTLTPSMFLHSLPNSEVPELDHLEKISLNKRLNYVNKIRQHLKQRFRKEYLGFLRSSKSHHRGTLKVDDVVLIGIDNRKRFDWPLAKVVELFPGKDGVIRLAKVKTSKGTFIRPVQRLYPLEVTDEQQLPSLAPPIDQTTETQDSVDKEKPAADTDIAVRTRYGRVVKPVKRLTI